MKSFKYSSATDAASAVRTVSANQSAKFLAGGTNLIDLMKEYVERPSELVDISRLDLAADHSHLERNFNRRVSQKYRHGEPSARPGKLPAPLHGDLSRRFRTASQYGDQRGKFNAAHPLPVFLRHRHAVQQTRAWHRMRGASWVSIAFTPFSATATNA